MVHFTFLLAHCLSQWYTTTFYWPTGYLYGTLLSTGPMVIYGTLLSSSGPMDIPMVHYALLLANWLSLCYTAIFYWPTGYLYGTLPSNVGPLAISLAICMVPYYLRLAHWLSVWYTTLSYWSTGYLYGTIPSSTGLHAIHMVHFPPLLAQWLSL